jgi:ribonuclease-3
VSTQSLARHAEAISLGDYLLLGRGEEKTGGRLKSALLADTYEALVAAIYLDGGLEPAAAFLHRELKDAIDGGSERLFVQDYKSALQERVQALGRPLPEYRVSGESGPDHHKIFSVEVSGERGKCSGLATGRGEEGSRTGPPRGRRCWPRRECRGRSFSRPAESISIIPPPLRSSPPLASTPAERELRVGRGGGRRGRDGAGSGSSARRAEA